MNKYSGSDFDDFLAEEQILDEISAEAQTRLEALPIAHAVESANLLQMTDEERLKLIRQAWEDIEQRLLQTDSLTTQRLLPLFQAAKTNEVLQNLAPYLSVWQIVF